MLEEGWEIQNLFNHTESGPPIDRSIVEANMGIQQGMLEINLMTWGAFL